LTRVGDLFSPLRYRDFRLLWAAQVTSELGDWAGRLALSVVVAEQTHSAFLTALVTTVSVIPFIGIGQVLATYANRFTRQQTIVFTDLGRAVIFAVLGIPLPVWLILVLAFIAGCMTPPFESARNALTPLSVPKERYGDAIALASVTFDMAVLGGYAAGGALLAIIGGRTALIVNACSFVLSAVLLSFIPVARQKIERGGEIRVRHGWRAVVDDPFVRRLLITYTVAGACAVVAESLVAVYALQVLMESAGVAGLLAAAIPVGAILATVIARPRGGTHTSKFRRASLIAMVGALAGMLLFASNPDLPVILFAFGAVGALNASRVPANEVAVIRLADRVRGPAITVMNGFILGSQAVAAAMGGLLAKAIGVRQTIVISLVLAAAVGAWGALNPPHELRHARRVT
jgi:MFS family permease